MKKSNLQVLQTPNSESKLLSCMRKKGISTKKLSELTGIPTSTLIRIIKNQVKVIKPKYIEAISDALNVPSYTIFTITDFNQPMLAAIRPDEAGTIVNKTLSEDESFLLYLYQGCCLESRKKIVAKAKFEFELSALEVLNKNENIDNSIDNYEQLKLSLHE